MAEFVKGDVTDDLILCQITSQTIKDASAVPINDSDFESGSLHQTSNVRPNRIFTVDRNIVMYQAARLKSEKVKQVIDAVVRYISS